MRIELSQVSKSYGDSKALDRLSLQLEATSCLTLIGPSGGGKSTLLRLLAGLEHPDSGDIVIDGKKLPQDESSLRRYRQSIGVVFQAYNLFPHLDAQSNIVLPLVKVHGLAPQDAAKRAKHLLDRFKLGPHSAKRPAQLSGGQNQRVAIARAISHDPSVIFFDEPTSALDPEMSAEVLDVIEELIQDGKKAIVVTHQMGFARRVGEHLAFIAQGQVIESSPSTDLFASPRTPEAKLFLSRVMKY